MSKKVTLEDLYNQSYQKQAAANEEMQKLAEAEDALNKMAMAAGYDFVVNQYNEEQEKRAASYLGELYAEAMMHGFYKAAELDGVHVQNDMPTNNNNVPSNPEKPVPSTQGGLQNAGLKLIQANLPKKQVGTITNPGNFKAAPQQVWATNANKPLN